MIETLGRVGNQDLPAATFLILLAFASQTVGLAVVARRVWLEARNRRRRPRRPAYHPGGLV